MGASNFRFSDKGLPTWGCLYTETDAYRDEYEFRMEDLREWWAQDGEPVDEDSLAEAVAEQMQWAEDDFWQEESSNVDDVLEDIRKGFISEVSAELQRYLVDSADLSNFGDDMDYLEARVSDIYSEVDFEIRRPNKNLSLFDVWLEAGYYDGANIIVDYDLDDWYYLVESSDFIINDGASFEGLITELIHKHVEVLDKELLANTNFRKIKRTPLGGFSFIE